MQGERWRPEQSVAARPGVRGWEAGNRGGALSAAVMRVLDVRTWARPQRGHAPHAHLLTPPECWKPAGRFALRALESHD